MGNNENRLNNYEQQVHKIFKNTNEGSYSSRYTYEASCNQFAKWLSNSEYKLTNIKNISFKHVDAYVKDCKENGLSSSTIMKNIAAIKYMSEKGNFKNRLPEDNKQWDLEKRNSGTIDRAWSQKEYNNLKIACEKTNRQDVIISAMLSKEFGLRLQETLHITPQQLKDAIKNKELHITKTKHGRPRTIKLTNEQQIKTAETLIKYSELKGIKNNQRIQETKEGILKEKQSIEKFIYNHQNEIIDKDYRKTEIKGQKIKEEKPTFHGLRYSYVQQLEKEGFKKYISQNTGHNRSEVDRVYLNKK